VTPVSRYGLHFASGAVGFLVQKTGSQSLYEGLPCPFEVQRSTYMARSCPHAVDLTRAADTEKHLLEDPLARWFANPKGVVLLQDGDPAIATRLLDMYTPTRPGVMPAVSMRTLQKWGPELACTDLSPLILANVGSTHLHILITALGYPRPILALTQGRLPALAGMDRITTYLEEVDLIHRDMAGLGAWATKRRLRG
jgi:hypothetical protein